MSYQVLARKYRPSNFEELEGQEHVLRALINALDQNRLHHAYLFTGTRGVGKTTIARILAKCLNCETGVTSKPCGQCGSCREIAEGRSVDLIEVDAASRTGVDDMRDLLDNVQYMPSVSRFKVYLIDEVHMLTKNSFNAMLKTLEEPPEHVKFLFATTDPKKLPVTVLSRCLQFNLKNLSPERIVKYLKEILPRESVSFDETALWQLGRAADGSMRDALSLTDQAIAFGDSVLSEEAVKLMLGSIDQREVYELLDGLIKHDGEQLLDKVRQLAEFAPDFPGLLDELLSVLHRIAVAQAIPEGIDNAHGDREMVLALAETISREDVQLYYQIGLIGKRDLPLAPDPRSGFEMILLRMMSFTPEEISDDPGAGRKSPVSELLIRINSSESAPDAVKPSPVAEHSAASGSEKTTASGSEKTTASGSKKTSTSGSQKSNISEKSGTVVAGPAVKATGDDVIFAELTSSQTDDPANVKSAPVSSISKVSKRPGPRAALAVISGDSNASSAATEPVDVQPDTTPPALVAHSDVRAAEASIVITDWRALLQSLKLSGVTQTLAANCTLKQIDGDCCQLVLNEHHASLWNKRHEARISKALTRHFKTPLGVAIEVGLTEDETPAQADRRLQDERQAQAVIAIENDETINTIAKYFDGTVNALSIRPNPRPEIIRDEGARQTQAKVQK